MKTWKGRGLLILAVAVFTLSCKEDKPGWDITIRGKVGFPQQGQIYIQEIKPDSSGVKDTIMLKSNYTYEKKIRVTEPGYYLLNFYEHQRVQFIVDKSDLEINVDGNDPVGFSQIKGSPDHDLINQVQQIMTRVQQLPDFLQIENEYAKASASQDKQRVAALQEEYMNVLNKGYDQVAVVLKDQPASLGLINLLQQNNLLDRDRHLDLYVSTAEKLKTAWPASRYTKDFTDMVEKMKVTAVGQVTPEIELPNPEGQVIKLSSLRGKYVLIDFWAKWCGPCRTENPNVVKAYNKFKGKGFEVFGVSLDRTKEDWVRAIAEDGLTWTHVSDLKYFESQAAKDYNINYIPFSVLIDPQGKIVAKNLRGPFLDKKLEEVLGGI